MRYKRYEEWKTYAETIATKPESLFLSWMFLAATLQKNFSSNVSLSRLPLSKYLSLFPLQISLPQTRMKSSTLSPAAGLPPSKPSAFFLSKYLSLSFQQIPSEKHLFLQLACSHYNRNAPLLNRLQLFSNPLYRCRILIAPQSTNLILCQPLQRRHVVSRDRATWPNNLHERWERKCPQNGVYKYAPLR